MPMPGKPAVEQASDGATKRPSGSTETYFRTGAEPAPLVVVYHIQKTAGTSLRRFVRSNLPPADLEIGTDLQKLRYKPDELLAWHREWYESLNAERRERLCCVMSHSAGYLLPALDRSAETLVLVREPVDRVLSFYYYKRRHGGNLPGPGRKTHFLSLEEIYSLDDDERARQRRPLRLESWHQFSNWQSRCLLAVFHDVSGLGFSDGPPADADLWRARLRELVEGPFYVGVQDRFAEYVELVGRRFGWKPLIRRSKRNEDRPEPAEVSPELRETIRSHNWLDAELQELCREIQLRREGEG